ncbi:RNA-directed DNA polymerase [Anaerococcus nagyae]|nr:RNA-directed DNA polymerase [Anaerococcus nagyae]
MNRFNLNDSRRNIYIPEIGSYIVLNNYIKQNVVLEDLIPFIEENNLSFSKIISEDGSIIKNDQDYSNLDTVLNKFDSNYIKNIVNKMIRSSGAKKILKLDISNCFSSIYTHYIPPILLGYEESESQYKKSLLNKKTSEIYNRYSKLDKIIRRLNLNQTNGLLVGPILSKIIAEGLLSRIDLELKDKGLVFSRYMDDYEVYCMTITIMK